MKLPFFKKADIFLFALIIALGAGSLLLAGSGKHGTVAVVRVDGEEVSRIQLTEAYQETVLETAYGTNTFAIEGGTIRVKEADCRGQDCVHFAPINKAGQTIVCLPHHLSVTIEGSSDGPDVVVR